MKHRTRKAAQKRFKLTKTGKLLHRSHYIRHLRSTKSKKQLRSLKKMKVVGPEYAKKIKQMLGVA